MEEAIKQAEIALNKNEVPIGAVITCNGKIIAKGFNKREKCQNALMHAEIVAINKACKKKKSWRLEDCEIYVTLEPCPMCAGAITNARLKKVVYGAKDKTSQDNIFETIMQSTRLNHNCEFCQDVEFEQKCSQLLSDFFKAKREKEKR